MIHGMALIALFPSEKASIGTENTPLWDIKAESSTTCLGPTPTKTNKKK
jgi:hypothetical protein